MRVGLQIYFLHIVALAWEDSSGISYVKGGCTCKTQRLQ
jgi:hypothetical protein